MSAFPEALLRLAPEQLTGSGDRIASRAIVTPSGALSTLVGIAFDASGNLWVASQDDSLLLRFSAAELGVGGATAADRVIRPNAGSLAGPTSLAFDPERRLWVANRSNGTLVRFDPAQLAAGGAASPGVVLSGLGSPTAIAFDAGGGLWMSDSRANTLTRFAPEQLAVSGEPAPTVLIGAAPGSLLKPAGIAFDTHGTLWVASTNGERVVGYAADQLGVSGEPAPRTVIASNVEAVTQPVGLAFDDAGDLWVVGGSGSLIRYSAASLAVSGAPAPISRFRLTGHAQFWSVAFWPRPAGLPLH